MRYFALLLSTLCFVMPSLAHAFHNGSVFADPPGKGGGGDIYYTGAPFERGWDCTMCHQKAPGRIQLRLDVEPKSLFDGFNYEPGASYTFTATLVGEHLGFEAGMSNFNALAASISDQEGLYAGKLSGPAFFSGGDGVIASKGLSNGETSWTFTWTAPAEAGRGTVALHLGLVDGNGADSAPTETRTDPQGDDVFMTRIELTEFGSTTVSQRSPKPVKTGSPWALILFAGVFWRRRRSPMRRHQRARQ